MKTERTSICSPEPVQQSEQGRKYCWGNWDNGERMRKCRIIIPSAYVQRSYSLVKPTARHRCPKRILNILFSKNVIYDIGTEILYRTCFGHNSTQNAPKSMIPVRVCTVFCVDAESAIKSLVVFSLGFFGVSHLVIV